MNVTSKFWQSVSEMTFLELMDISRYIAGSAKSRGDDIEFDIYDPAQFAEMMADYAEAFLDNQRAVS